MKQNKFFEKLLENISRIDEHNLKHVFELLEKERRTFRNILDYLDEAIIVFDDNQVVFINKNAQAIFQVSPDYLPVKIAQIRPLVANQKLFEHILSLCESNIIHSEFIIQTSKTFYFELENIITDNDSNIIKITDITDRKEMELQLKNLESIGALNTLAAGIAHEIKNPLSAIDLHTQIINKAIDKNIIFVPEQVDQYIHIIEEETKRLNKILNDFLISARKHEMKVEFTEINEYLESIISFITPELEMNNIALVKAFENIPKIFIDRNYLHQAILNILKNAIHAVENTDTRSIKITTYYDIGRDAVAIVVSDTGVGISQDMLPKIFQPYFTTHNNGTGLGLTIIYKIIKEHGGEIILKSQTQEEREYNPSPDPYNTSFTILLPATKGVKLLGVDENIHPPKESTE